MEQVELSYTVSGNEIVWQLSKTLNIFTIGTSHSTPRHSHKKNESIYLCENLYTNVYSIVICNRENWKQPKMPINGQMDILLIKRNELLIHKNMNGSQDNYAA